MGLIMRLGGVYETRGDSIQQRELLKIEDAGPAVRQRAERDLQVALDVITSLGLSPVDELEEAAND
ncbi:hypothetical protein QX25_20975 [Stutzerimonas stutzeri]|nr:hypothetical protein QX25_20975 [Stutzerimonas stutzeri]